MLSILRFWITKKIRMKNPDRLSLIYLSFKLIQYLLYRAPVINPCRDWLLSDIIVFSKLWRKMHTAHNIASSSCMNVFTASRASNHNIFYWTSKMEYKNTNSFDCQIKMMFKNCHLIHGISFCLYTVLPCLWTKLKLCIPSLQHTWFMISTKHLKQ